MDRKQLVVAWVMGVSVCICLFMVEDVILVKHDKAQVDKQREEHKKKDGLNQNQFWDSFADKYLFPYETKTAATNILGLKFKGDHYKLKFKIIPSVLIVGGLLIYTLGDRHGQK